MSYQNEEDGVDAELGTPFLVPEETTPSPKSIYVKIAMAVVFAAAIATLGLVATEAEGEVIVSDGLVTNLATIADQNKHFTGYNTGNTDRPIYLDRHNVDCGSNPLTLIKVQRNGDNIRYKYKCLEATASLDVTESWTENNGIQDAPRIHYLDRQNYMNCGNGGFITRFRAKNEGSHRLSYDYTCRKFSGVVGACSSRTTASSYIANEYIYYLDRFAASCPTGTAMNKFRPNGSGGNIYYQYTCCELGTFDPTPSPIANPTHKPISQPTHTPISTPTHKPTHIPIAEPTIRPSNEPTAPLEKLICPTTVTLAEATVRHLLPDGCAFVSMSDIHKSDYGSAPAALICGNLHITRAGLEDAGVVLPTSGKGHSLSYLTVANMAEVTVYTGSNFDGLYKSFEKGSAALLSAKLGGKDMNDRVHSIKLKVPEGTEVVQECPEWATK